MSKYVPMSAEAAFADIESIMGSDESALEKAKKLCYKGTVCYDNDDDIPAAAYYDEALATGVLEEYEEDGKPYFQLRLKELVVLDKRGQETVSQ